MRYSGRVAYPRTGCVFSMEKQDPIRPAHPPHSGTRGVMTWYEMPVSPCGSLC
jgi:hypothetical protein